MRGMRLAARLAIAALLLWSSRSPVTAQAIVTLSITADGDVAAGIVAASLPPAQVGTIDMVVADERGLAEGWDIVLSVDSPDTAIALVGRSRVVVVAGQPFVAHGPATGPIVRHRTPGTLHAASTGPGAYLGEGTSVLRAAPGSGSGRYHLTLAAVAQPLPDDATITLTVSLAP